MTYHIRRCVHGAAIALPRARTARERWHTGQARGVTRAIESQLALCHGLSAPLIEAAEARATAYERGAPDFFWQGDAFDSGVHLCVVGGPMLALHPDEVAAQAAHWSSLVAPWQLERRLAPEMLAIDQQLPAALTLHAARNWLNGAAEAVQGSVSSMCTRINCAKSYEAGWTHRAFQFSLNREMLLLGARTLRVLNLAWMLDLPKVAHATMFAMYDYVRGVNDACTYDGWLMRALFQQHTIDTDDLLGLGAMAEYAGFLLFIAGGASYQVTAMLCAASERYLDAEAAEPHKPDDNVLAFRATEIMAARARLRAALVPLQRMQQERISSDTLAMQAWVRKQHATARAVVDAVVVAPRAHRRRVRRAT